MERYDLAATRGSLTREQINAKAQELWEAAGRPGSPVISDVYYPHDPDCVYPWAVFRKQAIEALE